MAKNLLFLVILICFIQKTNAQLISNGGFGLGAIMWGCGIETNSENSYGGSGLNMVAEIDAGSSMCQTIVGLTIGDAYILSFNASRRTGGCPSPAITNVDINISGGALSTTVTRTNTTFGWTSSSYMFVANSVAHTITFSSGSGFGGSTCGMIMDNVALAFSPLPIKLLTFEGILKNNSVEFKWATATEKNNDYFEIERSANGIDFVTVLTTPSKSVKGNSSVKLNYALNDNTPQAGVNYYRLKQVDFDKEFSVSKIIAVSSEPRKEIKAVLYPNPNTGDFTIDAGISGSVSLSIVNHLGKVEYSEVQETEKESTLLKLNLKNVLMPGVYQCLVSSGDYFHSFHFIVQ